MTSEETRRRRRSPLSRRPVRIAVLVVIVLGVVATVVRIAWVRRSDQGATERWRRHDEALVLFEAERYGEAADAYRRILQDRPGDKIARFNLGLSLIRTGDDSGWSEIEAVVAADSSYDEALLALAGRALDRGETDAAMKLLTTAIERPPEPEGARSQLANLLLSMGRRADAMRHLRQVVEHEGGSALVRASAAVSLAREHGRQADLHRSPTEERDLEARYYRLALQEVDRSGILERDPTDWDETAIALAALRAFALAATERNEEALGAVEQAMRAPLDAATQVSLRVLRAQLYWFEGESQRAEAELQDALASDAVLDAVAYRAAADLYEGRGARERAAEVLARGVEEHPADARLRLSLARVLFLLGRVEDAETALQAADHEMTDVVTLFLGDLRRFRGDREAARATYASLLEGDAERLDVRLRIASMDAQAAFEAGDVDAEAFDALRSLAEQALEARPLDAEAMLALARALLVQSGEGDARERWEQARELLVGATDADPLLFEAHIVLAYVDAKLGNLYEAATGLERVIAALPSERPALRILLSEAYLGLGSYDRALAEAQRALTDLGDERRALTAVVAAAKHAGARDVALDAQRRLVQLEPDVLKFRLELAYLLAAAGDTSGADACFGEARQIALAIQDEKARAEALNDVADAQAEAFLERGDMGRARGTYAELLKRFPNSADARVAYARFLRATGSEEEAEEALQDALALDSESLVVRRALVDLWADRGEPSEELADIVRRMRTIGGDDALVLYAEGRVAALQGDLQLARERLERCVAGLRDDADAYFALGVVLSRGGRLEDAVRALERASALAPRSTRARDALARARFAFARELARLGRLNAARQMLEGTVEEDPDATEPRRALASLMALTLSVDLSENELREMLARDPEDPVVRRMLATALIQKEDYSGAARELLRVAEAVPEDWTVWSTLCLVRLELNDVEGATRWAARAREAAPDEPRALAPTLQVLVHGGRDAEARGLLDESIAARPRSGYLLLLRALMNAREGRHEEAVADARSALEASPGMTRAAHLGVYVLRYSLASPPRAMEFARECARRAPDIAEYAFLVGWLASDAGDVAAALTALEPLTERDPPHQPAVESAALLLMRGGQTSAAREALDRGLAVNPENPNFHYLRAQSLLRDAVSNGDPELRGPTRGAVIAALERTLELAPRHHTARNNLAFVLSTDDDRLADALEHAKRAVREAPRYPTYVDTLGTIQMRQGELGAAIESFQRALAIVSEALEVLKRPQSAVVVSEPGRAERLRRRLERQEAEIRRHYDEALRLRDGG